MYSYQESLKKKVPATKTLEEETINLENDPTIIETVVNEGTQFETTAKAKLNSKASKTLLSKAFPSQTKVKEQSHARNEIVKLPELEISRFHGDPTAWQKFIDSFAAAVRNSKSLSNVEKFSYLCSFLADDAQHAISGLSLKNDNYYEALNLLKN